MLIKSIRVKYVLKSTTFLPSCFNKVLDKSYLVQFWNYGSNFQRRNQSYVFDSFTSEMENLDTNITQNELCNKNGSSNKLSENQNKGVWIFGYASLMWNANFKYSKSRIGYIKNFVRRFWQGSTDHRGVPGKPGRVATLIPTERDKHIVWGKAYYIESTDVQETFEILDYREKGGYSQQICDFYPRENEEAVIPVVVYNAVEGNENFLGVACIDDIAKQISKSVGPSGPNKDYLYKLCETLNEFDIATEDDKMHTMELNKLVKNILGD
ncbi:putative glutathione-specific gamma-glutamylcyclotransferase 2 isoform X1 [Hydra vulgaris]|uniref:glutathione-specific gamma-glutamylcyclotransferase n=2 Tax=Hydra vulgaris TaxID=6087 RepID=A0ABM4DK06_HYDVU